MDKTGIEKIGSWFVLRIVSDGFLIKNDGEGDEKLMQR